VLKFGYRLLERNEGLMIECPWCHQLVHLKDNVCPNCKQEVLPEHLVDEAHAADKNYSVDVEELSTQDAIINKFKCAKCGNRECLVKEVAMNGTGFSKIFDIENNHFLFVSCLNCGFVEVYNPDVLRGHKSGKLGTIMDILFGG
jgi:predicted nucleic-acid-binding Zn-ribbon protein